MNKPALREKYRAIRADIYSKTKNDAVLKSILSLDAYRASKTVMIYCPINSEIDLTALSLDASKKFFVPRMLKGRRMEAVRFTCDCEMKCNSFGISEPVGKAYEGDIDLVLAPALAVSSDGFRLGYGGGYYDRFLHGKSCSKAAVVYDECILPHIPADEYDVKMDFIITDIQIYDLREKK